MNEPETYFSVDIETAGPNPADYAVLSIGACLTEDQETTFYCELKPDRTKAEPQAMAVHGLSIEELESTGTPPKEALAAFSDWVSVNTPENGRPVFVALNAAFDWMFLTDYFHRYLGRNPFGHNALDIKALYMGLMRIDRVSAVKDSIDRHYPRTHPLTHNALQDAIDQAKLFSRIIKDIRS
jgi:DNA polymerase III epsilon subunit-like protein